MASPFSTTLPPTLIDARSVAARLGCSVRHVWRLRDSGAMPPSVIVGTLVRWNSAVIDHWIAQGCPRRRQVVKS